MTKYEVLLSQTAVRQLRRFESKLQNRLKKTLAQLKNDPFNTRPKVDIKKLKGPNRDYYRLRIGDHRAIYVVEEKKVLVAKILPRSSAYDWIE